MDLKHLTDHQLKLDLQILVQDERALLTKILFHLKEIEARKLYSALGYRSLYHYACIELKYSDDQAFRRIQAMRLLKEIPEAARKIDSGELSLSNINQAQKYFNQAAVTSKVQKIEVLQKLIHKSVREGQKEILKLAPSSPLPPETKKQVTPNFTHASFNMSDELETKLEKIKSLLGPKSYNMSMAELIEQMADLSLQKLEEKRFGKQFYKNFGQKSVKGSSYGCTLNVQGESHVSKGPELQASKSIETHCSKFFETHCSKSLKAHTSKRAELSHSNRYVSKRLKYKIWQRDRQKCQKCSSQHNLQIDHIKPLSLGGLTSDKNLRLLCFNCNQRSRIEARL